MNFKNLEAPAPETTQRRMRKESQDVCEQEGRENYEPNMPAAHRKGGLKTSTEQREIKEKIKIMRGRKEMDDENSADFRTCRSKERRVRNIDNIIEADVFPMEISSPSNSHEPNPPHHKYSLGSIIHQSLEEEDEESSQSDREDVQYPQSPFQSFKFTTGSTYESTDPTFKLESPIYYKSFFELKAGVAVLTNRELKLPEATLRLKDVEKVKITQEAGINKSRKIKINYFTQIHTFSVSEEGAFFNFPLHYCWLAKLITEKLCLKGFDLAQPYVPAKPPSFVTAKNAIFDGILYKKSQVLGKWELRYVAITPSGVTSFKNQASGETFSIKKESITELWTRFDIYEKMLVVKIQHSKKTEFGIPIVNFCGQWENNWLWAFYKLVYAH